VTFTERPAPGVFPLQTGYRANGKNLNSGGSAWFFWNHEGATGAGDINIDLEEWVCKAGDSCWNGECTGGDPVECRDYNLCTEDYCDPDAGACAHDYRADWCEEEPPEECVCAGVQRMTLKLHSVSDNRDDHEDIRVRAGSINGPLLWDDGHLHDVGDVISFDVPTGTERIYVTVQGDNHDNETIKADFVTDCDLAAGQIDGNSYIKFKVDAVTQTLENCPNPPVTPRECTSKVVQMRLRYTGPAVTGSTTVSIVSNDVVATYSFSDGLMPGQVLQSAAQNGWSVDAFAAGADSLGSKAFITINGVEEGIHTSCSVQVSAPAPAPLNEPKGDPSTLWFIEDFTEKNDF
jgi:hypothetical protein